AQDAAGLPDHIDFTFAEISGDVPMVSIVPNTDPLSAGASFGATNTTAPGTNPIDEVQTLTIDTAPTTNGDITVTVAGTAVVVPVVGGETTIETAARIAAAIDALADITATVAPGTSEIEITYAASLGDVAEVAFVDTDTTGALATAPTVTAGQAPGGGTQKGQVTGGAVAGGAVRVGLGGRNLDTPVPAGLTVAELGVRLY